MTVITWHVPHPISTKKAQIYSPIYFNRDEDIYMMMRQMSCGNFLNHNNYSTHMTHHFDQIVEHSFKKCTKVT